MKNKSFHIQFWLSFHTTTAAVYCCIVSTVFQNTTKINLTAVLPTIGCLCITRNSNSWFNLYNKSCPIVNNQALAFSPHSTNLSIWTTQVTHTHTLPPSGYCPEWSSRKAWLDHTSGEYNSLTLYRGDKNLVMWHESFQWVTISGEEIINFKLRALIRIKLHRHWQWSQRAVFLKGIKL